jgi:hypothetical protein
MSATSGSPRSKVFKYPRIAPWWEAKLVTKRESCPCSLELMDLREGMLYINR